MPVEATDARSFEDALGALILAHAREPIADIIEALDEAVMRLSLAEDAGRDFLEAT